MTRSGIFAATALSLSLAMAAPALAQQARDEHAGRAAGVRTGSGNFGGARSGAIGAQTNFRAAGAQANVGASSNFAGRGNAQFARGGEFRGDRGRGFGRDVGIAAGVAAGSALAYGGYGYGYDPYNYGDSYAYDAGSYYDPGYAVTYDQPLAEEPIVGGPAIVGDASYCAQRYRSYDPASGTYLGFDGLRHPCP